MWSKVAVLLPAVLLPAALAGASEAVLGRWGERVPERIEVMRELDGLGANGRLPRERRPGPELLDQAGEPRELATGAGPLVDAPAGELGIPRPVLAAYATAADGLARTHPECGLHWSVLASVGRIESGHARGGRLDVVGTTVSAILGPRLSGGPGVAAVRDTDGGALDGDPVWDRAMGAMQFIPETWRKYAVDGNEDGVASPHNVHDAALAAGRYLCSDGSDLRDPRNLAAAVFRYNHSDSYVRTVLVWAAAYALGVTPTPSELAPEVDEDDVLEGNRLPEGPEIVALPSPRPGEPPVTAPPGRLLAMPPEGAGPSAGAGAGPLPGAGPSPDASGDPQPLPGGRPQVPAPSGTATPEPSGVPPTSTSSSGAGTSSSEAGESSSTPPSSAKPPSSANPPSEASTSPSDVERPPSGSAEWSSVPPSSTHTQTGPPSSGPPWSEQSSPAEGSPSEPSSESEEVPDQCDPKVLEEGAFALEPSGSTIPGPGETPPSDARPGGIVYAVATDSDELAPCSVPAGFEPSGASGTSAPLRGAQSATPSP